MRIEFYLSITKVKEYNTLNMSDICSHNGIIFFEVNAAGVTWTSNAVLILQE